MTKIYRGITNNRKIEQGSLQEIVQEHNYMWISNKFGSWVAIKLDTAELIKEF